MFCSVKASSIVHVFSPPCNRQSENQNTVFSVPPAQPSEPFGSSRWKQLVAFKYEVQKKYDDNTVLFVEKLLIVLK
jgi:hypothetical protein